MFTEQHEQVARPGALTTTGNLGEKITVTFKVWQERDRTKGYTPVRVSDRVRGSSGCGR
jgi:hypothetical protein